MLIILPRFIRSRRGTAAVEAAIFAPIFLIFTFGVTDLGSEMFVRMTVNAATQAGARSAIVSGSVSGAQTAMNDAAGDPSFCTIAVCASSITPSPCVAGDICIVTVSATYPFSPILPDAVYSWAQSQVISSTVTVRVQ
jgi:Flp pilus assembly protein TadG